MTEQGKQRRLINHQPAPHPRAKNSGNNMESPLVCLTSLSHQTLQERWEEVFGITVPIGLSRRLMIYALAYEQQAQQTGRLKPRVTQQLQELAGVIPSSPLVRTALAPGTRLMREWRGTVHVVDVTVDGLVWNGRTFRSLSAIARTITGTRWSGHRFFGLRKRKASASHIPDNNIDEATTKSMECRSNKGLQNEGSTPAEWGVPSTRGYLSPDGTTAASQGPAPPVLLSQIKDDALRPNPSGQTTRHTKPLITSPSKPLGRPLARPASPADTTSDDHRPSRTPKTVCETGKVLLSSMARRSS